jgi:hypothetical protein
LQYEALIQPHEQRKIGGHDGKFVTESAAQMIYTSQKAEVEKYAGASSSQYSHLLDGILYYRVSQEQTT